ncbi:Peptidyl-prolyl cis-trans isomerase B [Actinomadura rubteroloni]|uniref:Peptidyl-prolyl cis-trans isomerase n=1 Tax=Actinomadura rubteroloni TaxID=1926885 RepID=A0A2P4UMM9_9ACTN|nr:peptidylprolyl isomerase [Actinomadura rubteroloni]POM26303.1 Peptidyl-prolyl cis-trans isomerase B [Actinomadura rubteroloni]
MAEEIFATLNTTAGKIVVQLYPQQAPETVANFVGLAEGGRPWTHPATGQKTEESLYAGTIFHRVIPNFMIQGGDPLGTGTGGPGYQFKDEFDPSLKFDRPYLLAMANAGPGTNGSQFFITTNVQNTAHLTGRHTIFGKVVEGTNVVDAISGVETGRGDRPVQDVAIESVTIERRQS